MNAMTTARVSRFVAPFALLVLGAFAATTATGCAAAETKGTEDPDGQDDEDDIGSSEGALATCSVVMSAPIFTQSTHQLWTSLRVRCPSGSVGSVRVTLQFRRSTAHGWKAMASAIYTDNDASMTVKPSFVPGCGGFATGGSGRVPWNYRFVVQPMFGPAARISGASANKTVWQYAEC